MGSSGSWRSWPPLPRTGPSSSLPLLLLLLFRRLRLLEGDVGAKAAAISGLLILRQQMTISKESAGAEHE